MRGKNDAEKGPHVRELTPRGAASTFQALVFAPDGIGSWSVGMSECNGICKDWWTGYLLLCPLFHQVLRRAFCRASVDHAHTGGRGAGLVSLIVLI